MLKFLLWLLLLVFCWPLAILAVLLWPLVWLVLLPFRLIGIAVVNSGGGAQVVPPFGGLGRRLSTNPISIAAPISKKKTAPGMFPAPSRRVASTSVIIAG